MAKNTETQRDFTLGVLREEFLEGDDLELRKRSLRGGKNVRIKATRSVCGRPGTFYRRTKANSYDIIELRPQSGAVFGLLIGDTTLDVIDSAGRSIWTLDPAPWTDGADVWVEPFSEKTVLGGSWGLKVLTYNGGSWVLSDFGFDPTTGGQIAQPYWIFNEGVTIRPSAISGSITVTASAAIFTPSYVGLRIRYGEREILITGYTSPTLVSGTVISALKPSYRLTFASTANFNVGDAIVGQVTDYQGLIISKTSTTIDVVTTEFLDGPDVSEKVSAPSGTATVTAKAVIAPLASPIWDEPLISPVRGYPRAGASAGGRLTFVDFPQVPDLIAMSSTRAITDFEVGAEDDDAILRQAGENSPRFLHVINAGDLLLFSDKGLYYVELRSGNLLTPTSFNPVQFDKRAAAPVRPVAIDDGAAFVEASGQTIATCQLTGNVNLRWTVRSISIYHNQLINAPVKLCGPSLFSVQPEKYLFVVNADGTLAAMSWFEEFSIETIGFIPWETEGAFKSVSPIFGGYWAIVERDLDVGPVTVLEEFSQDTVVDCACIVAVADVLEVNGANLEVNGDNLEVSVSGATPLATLEVALVGENWFGGLRTVDAGGNVPDATGYPSDSYVGLDFPVWVEPWPVEMINTPRSGMLKARVIRGSVSLLNTLTAYVRANRTTKRFGGYAFGDDLSEAPPLMTQRVKFSVVGNRDHPELEIGRSAPGKFEVMSVTQEVQV